MDKVSTAVVGLRGAPRLLAACSGGADSVALAHALDVAIAHIDHGLRRESGEEAEQVRELARSLGVPFYLERLEGLETREKGLEAAAREARYAALARIAARASATRIATAHTRTDQAETLLLRLLRGAGPGALAGVRKSRPLAEGVSLVRPLLTVSRSDTEAYCAAHGLPHTTDPHNRDPARMRARLRALWPQLLALNPRLEEALSGTADILADEDELLQAAAEADLSDLRGLHPALQRRAILALAARSGVRPERAHVEELRRLIARGRGDLDVPGGRATVRQGRLSFGEAPAALLRPAELAVPGPGDYAWETRRLRVSMTPSGTPVDLARAPFPWRLRGFHPGDRFRPARGRTRKIADLWIDARIPREARATLAVLADAHGRPFWVEGIRPGEASESTSGPAAFFSLRPEMEAESRTLTPKQQRGARSATMKRLNDEEPR